MDLKTYKIVRPLEIEFESAHLSYDRLREKVDDLARRYKLSLEQSKLLRNRVYQHGQSDVTPSSPELLEPSLLPTALKLFGSSRLAQRNFLIWLFGDMARTNIADPDLTEFDYGDELKTLLLSDFIINDAECSITFEAVATSNVALSDIEEYLDGQISDGWGENGTEQQQVSIDVRDIEEPVWRSIMLKYNDILLSDYEPVVTRYFDERNKSRLVINDANLNKMAKLANAINVRAFVMTY